MTLLINISAFKVGWLSSVLGGAYAMPWLGPLVAAAVLGIHLWFARQPRRELILVGCAALLGLSFDSLLLATDWVRYSSGLIGDFLAPYWIVSMWVLFAMTLNVSLRWLHGRPWLAAVFGLVGGPLAYLAGQKLGGIDILAPAPALIALALGWALIMPLLIRIAASFDGFSRDEVPA